MHCTRWIFMGKKHLNAAILKSNLSNLRLTKLYVKHGSNYCSLKICQPIYIDHIGCIALGGFLWEKISQRRHFKSNLSKLWYFYISQTFFWMETDTQKLTKSHVQPCKHCSLKIYQPIYIDHIICSTMG